jgi:hypothetical protein
MLASAMPVGTTTSLGARSWRVSCLSLLGCGENSRFGSRDQAATAPRVVIFLKTSSRLPGKGPMFWSVGWRGAAGVGCCLGCEPHGTMYIMVDASESTSSSNPVGSCQLFADPCSLRVMVVPQWSLVLIMVRFGCLLPRRLTVGRGLTKERSSALWRLYRVLCVEFISVVLSFLLYSINTPSRVYSQEKSPSSQCLLSHFHRCQPLCLATLATLTRSPHSDILIFAQVTEQ